MGTEPDLGDVAAIVRRHLRSASPQWPMRVAPVITLVAILAGAAAGSAALPDAQQRVVLASGDNVAGLGRIGRFSAAVRGIDARGRVLIAADLSDGSRQENRATANDPRYVALPVPDARGEGAQRFSVSQDGGFLGFRRLSQRDGVVRVWTFDRTSGQLTDVGVGDLPTVDVDGRHLLYATNEVPFGLRLLDLSTSDTVDFPNIAYNLEFVHQNLGSVIFTSDGILSDSLGTEEPSWQVFAMDKASRRIRQLSSIPYDPYDREVQSVAIAAKGDLVAFVARPRSELPGQVFVANATTGTVTQLTQEADGCYDVTMSVDGARIACDCGRLVVIDTSTHDIREVLSDTGFRSQPKLSGNGRHLAFVAARNLDGRGSNPDGNAEVFTWDVNSGDFTQVTDTIDGDSDPVLWAIDEDAETVIISLHADLNGSQVRPYNIRAVRTQEDSNEAPVIVGPTEVTATLGQTTSIVFSASDAEGRRIEFHLERADRKPPQRIGRIGDVELLDPGNGTATVSIRPLGSPRAQYDLRIAAFDPDGGVSVHNVVLVVQRGCAGDCDLDRHLSINELVRQVGIALGRESVDECGAADLDADQTITVAEIVRSVEVALAGC